MHVLIIDHVTFVQEDDDVFDADLAAKQNVFSRLRHRTVGGRDNKNTAVHASGTSNHVLDIIGVTRAVDMAVVPCLALIFNRRCVDSDTSRFLLRSLINIRVILELSLLFIRQILRDGCCQCRLPVIDVTDGSNIQVLLAPIVLCEGSALHGTE